MKNIFFLALMLFAFSCKKSEVAVVEPTKIITGSLWKFDRFSDINGKSVSAANLKPGAQILFGFEFEFLSTNVVRARDGITKQIVNAGEWRLIDNKTVYIDVSLALTGNLEVIDLSRNKMILQIDSNKLKNNNLLNANQIVNMEFIPAL